MEYDGRHWSRRISSENTHLPLRQVAPHPSSSGIYLPSTSSPTIFPIHSTPSTWLSHPTPGFLLCGALPSASLPAFPSVLDLATPRAGPEPGEAFTEIPQIPTPLHTDLLSSDSWTLTSALWHLSLQGPGAVLPVGPRGLHSGEMLKMVPLSAMPVVSGPQNGGRSWGGVPRSACA